LLSVMSHETAARSRVVVPGKSRCTSAEVVWGNLTAVAGFLLLYLSRRNHASLVWAFGVNLDNDLGVQQAQADLARFVAILPVCLPRVFTRAGEVVPICIASDEVQTLVSEGQLALGFVPGQDG
jgi:hypothetical protein